MTENGNLQVGQEVPDVRLATYEPETNDFGEFHLAEAKS